MEGLAQEDRRIPVLTALLVTLLLHSLLLWTLPANLFESRSYSKSPDSDLTVELEEAPEKEFRFVETNPDVPQNEPDKTRNVAARSQQAAQEKVTEEPLGDTPKVTGEVDESQKIVDGALETPLLSGGAVVVVDQQPEATPQEPSPLAVLIPGAPPMPPEFLREDSVEEKGLGPLIVESKTKENSEDSRIIDLNSNSAPNAQSVPVPLDSTEPLARPRLNFQVVPGPVRNSPSSVSSLGVVAIDAQFSQFGEYTQRMIEAISGQWHLLARNFNHSFQDMGSRVKIEFNLTPEGRVENLIVKETASSRPATLLCKDAILSRAPFGEWNEEMVAMLGDNDRVKITFYYR